MQVRGLLAGAVLLAVLAGLVYWSQQQGDPGEAKDETPKLIGVKPADMTRIEIRRSGAEPVVLERSGDAWKMQAPQPVRTDEEAASALAGALSEFTWERLIEEKAGDLQTYGLASPAVEVKLETKGGKSRTVQIGDEMPVGGAYYAKLAGDPRVFSVPSGTHSALDKTWQDLRDKRLLIFEAADLTGVETYTKGRTASFTRNPQKEWQITAPRQMRADNWAIEELLTKLREARLTPASPEEEKNAAAAFAAAPRVGIVTLQMPSGAQSLEVRKRGEEYLARSSAVEGVWSVSKELGDAIAKSVEEYRARKVFDFGFSDPTKVVVRDGGKTLALTRKDGKWWSDGKQMDSTSVQSLIDKLRDLSATGFPQNAPSSADMEISVTSLDGKRTEKVTLTQSGANWYARRENDPVIYGLETSRAEELRQSLASVRPPPPPPPAATR